MSITTTILFNLFLSQSPDVCAVTYPDSGHGSLYCDPARIGAAPLLDSDVCCDDYNCILAKPTGCSSKRKLYYAQFGKADPVTTKVQPYFEVPDWCDLNPCIQSPNTIPQESFMCCMFGVCVEYWNTEPPCDIQDIYWCQDGVCNQDGTVTCFEGDY